MNIHTINLDKLNSLTKYPSILTYHGLGERGVLTEEVLVLFPDTKIIGTEKIDGTNGRIIIFPDGSYLIGSREELLYAAGDLIENPSLSIVPTLKPIAQRVFPFEHNIIVVYAEIYGGNVTSASKTYTTKKTVSARMFDIAFIPPFTKDGKPGYEDMFHWPREKIAGWRDNGGQDFFSEEDLIRYSQKFNLELTPRIDISPLPTSVNETFGWLRFNITTSKATLENDAPGKPEGIVVRTPDRKYIAKIRFEDYERTMKARGKKI